MYVPYTQKLNIKKLYYWLLLIKQNNYDSSLSIVARDTKDKHEGRIEILA